MEDNHIKPLFGVWCQKILPLVYDESLSYYEVLCKVQHKLNEVIKSQNNLQDEFYQLKNWIDSQLEKYSKEQLEQWLNDGTLENMIMALGQIVKYFDTTEEMILSSNLQTGQVIQTLGYSSINDNGEGRFKIVNEIDENSFQFSIGNGKFATLIEDDTIYLNKRGGYGNITNLLQEAVNELLNGKKHKIIINKGNYRCDTITIKRNVSSTNYLIDFCGSELTGNNNVLFNCDVNTYYLTNFVIKNCIVNNYTTVFNLYKFSYGCVLKNIGWYNVKNLIISNESYYYIIDNVYCLTYKPSTTYNNDTLIILNTNSNLITLKDIHGSFVHKDIVSLNGTQNIRFIHCGFEQVMNNAISFSGNNFITNFEDCYFENIPLIFLVNKSSQNIAVDISNSWINSVDYVVSNLTGTFELYFDETNKAFINEKFYKELTNYNFGKINLITYINTIYNPPKDIKKIIEDNNIPNTVKLTSQIYTNTFNSLATNMIPTNIYGKTNVVNLSDITTVTSINDNTRDIKTMSMYNQSQVIIFYFNFNTIHKNYNGYGIIYGEKCKLQSSQSDLNCIIKHDDGYNTISLSDNVSGLTGFTLTNFNYNILC